MGVGERTGDYEARVVASFERQTLMRTIGARISALGPGTCALEMPVRPDLCQQHGFVHAGVTTALADTAAGYAAFTLMPGDSSVLTIEFKVNLLAPARGEMLVARAAVQGEGDPVTFVRSEVFAISAGRETSVAAMLATMMCMKGTPDAAQG
jgi:uncharacterized protein (TIGR00369 family)